MSLNNNPIWIYKIYPTFHLEISEEELNKLGEEGWEMCGVLTKPVRGKLSGTLTPENFYYFKKQI